MIDRDEDERIKRRREREDEQEAEQQAIKNVKGSALFTPSPDNELGDLIQQVEAHIEQLNQLYAMYFSGVEKIPPRERRQLLEALMQRLQSTPRPTPSANFRYQAILLKFNSYRDRWDKQLKLREGGKR